MKRLLYTCCLILMTALIPESMQAATDTSQYDYALYTSDMQAMAGRQMIMTLSMKNATLISGYQADLVLPDGFTIATIEDENGNQQPEVTLLRTLSNRHTLSTKQQADGSYRLLSTSNSNKNYGGYDGPVAYITINVADNVADGSYTLTIKNQEMAEVSNTSHKVTATEATITVVSSQVTLDKPENDVEITNLTEITNSLYTTPIYTVRGGKASVDVMLRNTDDITGFQTDILLPSGFTLSKDAISYGERTDESRHFFNIAQQTDGSYRLIAISTGNKNFTGNDGVVATITFDVSNDLLPGEYKVIMRNQELAKADNTRLKPENVTSRLKVELPGFTYDLMHLEPYLLYTDNMGAKAGDQVTLSIGMVNLNSICGFQADMVLPDGVTVATTTNQYEETEPMITYGDRTTAAQHTINCVKQADGTYRILCASIGNKNISGHIGILFNITLNIDPSVKTKDYPVYFINQEFGEADNTIHKASMPFVSRLFVRDNSPEIGDVYPDGNIDLKDLNALREILFHIDTKEYNREAGDTDKDGHFSISDIMHLIKELRNKK